MKRLLLVFILIPALFIGCDTKYWHQQGGPYYFKSHVTYQGFYPTGEITKKEALDLSKQGYAYTVAYFNDKGQPTYMEKRYSPVAEGHLKGKVEKFQLFYENEKLSKMIYTDINGQQKISLYDKKGRLSTNDKS